MSFTIYLPYWWHEQYITGLTWLTWFSQQRESVPMSKLTDGNPGLEFIFRTFQPPDPPGTTASRSSCAAAARPDRGLSSFPVSQKRISARLYRNYEPRLFLTEAASSCAEQIQYGTEIPVNFQNKTTCAVSGSCFTSLNRQKRNHLTF